MNKLKSLVNKLKGGNSDTHEYLYLYEMVFKLEDGNTYQTSGYANNKNDFIKMVDMWVNKGLNHKFKEVELLNVELEVGQFIITKDTKGR